MANHAAASGASDWLHPDAAHAVSRDGDPAETGACAPPIRVNETSRVEADVEDVSVGRTVGDESDDPPHDASETATAAAAAAYPILNWTPRSVVLDMVGVHADRYALYHLSYTTILYFLSQLYVDDRGIPLMTSAAAMGQNRRVPRVSVTTFEHENLRAQMKARGWSAERLAVRAGLRTQAVGTYASGNRRPSPTALAALAKALEVETTKLAPLSDDPPLHELRWHSGLTVSALADRVGISEGLLGGIMRGADPLPTESASRRRLAAALGVDAPTLKAAWTAARREFYAD